MKNINNMPGSFVAIDFETATGQRNSACSVGIVTFKNGKITEEFHTLIQPPYNEYFWRNTEVHGITDYDTRNAGSFDIVFPEIYKRLKEKTIVAHNESFDRSVLKQSMELYGIDASDLNLQEKWECTMKTYKAKGFKPANLAACCDVMDIELQHHEALSDARACGRLFLKK